MVVLLFTLLLSLLLLVMLSKRLLLHLLLSCHNQQNQMWKNDKITLKRQKETLRGKNGYEERGNEGRGKRRKSPSSSKLPVMVVGSGVVAP